MTTAGARLDADRTAGRGRLSARPGVPLTKGQTGRQALKLAAGRDGLLYVPASYRAARPAPMVVMLHGAGGAATSALAHLIGFADAEGIILVAPDSRGRTWDLILGGYGPDAEFLDRALDQIFSRYAIDAERLALGGFSDGASYALSLGITNGDLFSHLIAFSPGFVAPASQHGAPRIFVSHGVTDHVLPIDRCSRAVAPRLDQAGYDLRYVEFEGAHTVAAVIARDAVEWFLR